jgi:hypothetical protein
MARFEIAIVAAVSAFALALLPAQALPRNIHQADSLMVPAKVNCPTWCGKTVWVTKANGFTTKSKIANFGYHPAQIPADSPELLSHDARADGMKAASVGMHEKDQ